MNSLYNIIDYTVNIVNAHNTNIQDLTICGFDGETIFHEYTVNNNKFICTAKYSHINILRNCKSIIIDIINKVPLWVVKYEIDRRAINGITISIYIDKKLIKDYLYKSVGLFDYVLHKNATHHQRNYGDHSLMNLKNVSYIPTLNAVEPPKDFKISLHNYQKKSLAKMLLIEKNKYNFNLDLFIPTEIDDVEIIYDPIKCCISDKFTKLKVVSKGGVLADEMGLGKTITTVSLIATNPKTINPAEYLKVIKNTTKIISKASLIVCPSHLLSQWTSEVNKCCPHLQTLVIATKTNYTNLTFDDFINKDIIITSYQFIMNFNFYPSLYYNNCTASSFNFINKNASVKSALNKILADNKTFDALKKVNQPIFEFFDFHRLVLDETHEIFGNMLSNRAQSEYMTNWVSSIDAENYWYVSGTPFVNNTGILNCAKYIGVKLVEENNNTLIDFGTNYKSSENLYYKCINTSHFWDDIFKNLCIRHRKKDVIDQIDILGYQERVIWVNFTDIEKQLYQAKKPSLSPMELQQLCCHPLIVQSAKKIFGGLEEIDLDVMKDKMIAFHKNQLETYTNRLKALDKSKPEYAMLSTKYNSMVSESKFILVIFEKLNQPNAIEEECCSICMDYIEKPTLTACGHMFCYDCIKMCLTSKKKCPYCKADLTGKEIMVIDKNKAVDNTPKETQDEVYNALIEKYGSKLGKLISIIRCLVARDETRIILFSQWDDMLSLIGKSLAENGIANSFVKGNVWSRNAAINKFKSGKNKEGIDNKVIMLSLKNAASGTNLTEATHIFFVEPVDVPRTESQAIESQAIARACRIGQKQQVLIMRIIIENCIEEEIYKKYYDPNPIINYEEREYFLYPPKKTTTKKETDTETSDKVEKPKRTKKAKVEGEVKPVKKRTTKSKVVVPEPVKEVKPTVAEKKLNEIVQVDDDYIDIDDEEYPDSSDDEIVV